MVPYNNCLNNWRRVNCMQFPSALEFVFCIFPTKRESELCFTMHLILSWTVSNDYKVN